MIVIPQAVVLSAETPLTHSRIGYQTFTRDDGVVVSASSETSDGPKEAVLEPETVEFWQPSAMPAYWTIDLGSLQEIDYVGIAGHQIGSLLATVSVETSTDGIDGSPSAGWLDFSSDIAPTDDAPIMFIDEPRFTRFVRIRLTGDDAPRIAVIYVGSMLAMQRPIYGGHTPITLSRDTVLSRSMSEGGQFLGQGFVRMGVSTSVAFRHLTAAWYRENFDPFVMSARQYPYFFAWRPQDFPLEVAYVWTSKDIKPANMGIRDFMSVGWELNGIGNE